MSGWQSTLTLYTSAISNLLNSPSTARSRNRSEPLENDDEPENAGSSIAARIQVPPRQHRNGSRRPEGSTYIECLVCTSSSDEVGFSTDPPTSACRHSPEVCVECLQQVILTAINSGEFITGILCPSLECSQKLDYYDIRKWATQEVFDRYDKLLLQNSLRTDDHYVLCLEPSCAAGQVHTGGEISNIVTCHHCGSKQCFRHQVLWHEGFTCEQWDEHQDTTANQQEMTDEWIQAETKPCPGPGCGRRIQKDEGCDHMTCRRPGGCGHQFCWECLAPWLQIIAVDNSRHYDDCQYYTGQPGNNPAPAEILAATAVRDHPLPPLPPLPPPLPLPVTAHRQRPILTRITLQNGQLRPPARRPLSDDIPGEAQRLARLRAIFVEDRPSQGGFAQDGRLRRAQDATRNDPLPRHDRQPGLLFRRVLRRDDDHPLRDARDNDYMGQLAERHYPELYDPSRNDERREHPHELPNPRGIVERDRERTRVQPFRTRPVPPPPPSRTRLVPPPSPPPSSRTRRVPPPSPPRTRRVPPPPPPPPYRPRTVPSPPSSRTLTAPPPPPPPPPPPSRTGPFPWGEMPPNGGLRPLRLVDQLHGDPRPPTAGPRTPSQPFAGRHVDSVSGSPRDYPPNSPFGPSSRRLEPLHVAPGTSQAVAGPGPGTQARQNGMDPARQAEISAWALQSNPPGGHRPNGSSGQRINYPSARFTNSPATRPLVLSRRSAFPALS